MGEARKRFLDAARVVTVDLSAVPLQVENNDRVNLGVSDKDDAEARTAAARFLITRLINLKHPQGMDRTDGKIFAALQDAMEETGPVEMLASQVRWLAKIAEDDTLKVDVGLVRWREQFVDFLDKIMTAEKAEDEGGVT